MQNEKSLSLRSPELLPTKDSERNLSLWDYTILWAGMTINIVAFSLGAQYFNGGKHAVFSFRAGYKISRRIFT